MINLERKYFTENFSKFEISPDDVDNAVTSLYLGDKDTKLTELDLEDLIGFTLESVEVGDIIENPFQETSELHVIALDPDTGQAVVELKYV